MFNKIRLIQKHFKQGFRALNTLTNYDDLLFKYKELGGCLSCYESGRYECRGLGLSGKRECSQPEKDHSLLLLLRTSILDVQYIREMTKTKKTVLQLPSKSPNNLSGLKFDNWSGYLKSRGVALPIEPQSLRFLSKALTYPLTIAQFLNGTPPYQLTEIGTKSFSELSGIVGGEKGSGLLGSPFYLRICILGPRAEVALPNSIWAELTQLFPTTYFSLLFIGPEIDPVLDKQTTWAHKRISMSYIRKNYHDVHANFVKDDYIPDFYVGLNTGVGFIGYNGSWDKTVDLIFQTKKPFLFSSHNEEDLERDYNYVKEREKDIDWLLKPCANRFSSLFYDFVATDIRNVINPNHSVFAIQGKT